MKRKIKVRNTGTKKVDTVEQQFDYSKEYAQVYAEGKLSVKITKILVEIFSIFGIVLMGLAVGFWSGFPFETFAILILTIALMPAMTCLRSEVSLDREERIKVYQSSINWGYSVSALSFLFLYLWQGKVNDGFRNLKELSRFNTAIYFAVPFLGAWVALWKAKKSIRTISRNRK